jgi:hypothetical protein
MPGVLMIEGMAQLAGLLLEASLHQKHNRQAKAILTVLERTKFRELVRPGDTLTYRAEVIAVNVEGGKSKSRDTIPVSPITSQRRWTLGTEWATVRRRLARYRRSASCRRCPRYALSSRSACLANSQDGYPDRSAQPTLIEQTLNKSLKNMGISCLRLALRSRPRARPKCHFQ